MAVDLSQSDKEIIDSLVEVSPSLAAKYKASRYPELQRAGALMLEFIEAHRAPEGVQSISLEELNASRN